VDYDKLTTAYWEKQVERTRKVLDRIVSNPQAVVPGRVVPDRDDLALGTGRALKAAILFTDISGFSSRPSGDYAQQNSLLQVLNLYFTEMIRIAEEYGGTVEKNTGDGLMAYFEDGQGDPAEKGSVRALTSALTMMYVTAFAVNPILRSSSIPDISFRVGIDYGPVTIAQLGAAKRFGGLVAVGATANIANKMLTEADPGDIVIGNDVVLQLPLAWQQRYCALLKTDTGFVYLLSGAPDPL